MPLREQRLRQNLEEHQRRFTRIGSECNYSGSCQCRLALCDEKNNLVRSLSGVGTTGFHSLSWDLKINEVAPVPARGKAKPAPTPAALKYASKGKYKVKFINGSDSSETTVDIK